MLLVSLLLLSYHESCVQSKYITSQTGEVSKVFVHKDTGRADVTFKFKEDAKRAIQRYDRVTLDGRPMRVSMKDAGSASSTERASGSGPFSRDHAFGAARQSDPIPARKEINQPTTFSVTLAGLDNLKKKDNNVSKKPKAKANKPKAVATSDKKQNRREKPAPMDASSLDNDMDSYFAARSNKSTTEDA